VQSHLVALHSLLRSAAQQASVLPQRLAQIGAEVARQACGGAWVLEAAPRWQPRELRLLDPAGGSERVRTVPWEDARELQVLASRPRPCGYWLAADALEAVTRLRRLGVTVRSLTAALPLQVQRYRPTALALADEPGRGRTPSRHLAVALEDATLEAPAGSHYVPLDQPLANLIASALEPDTPYSWYAQQLLPRLDALARVTAPPPAP
jgi:hypothetical protein